MSFRVEGQEPGEVIASIEADLRFLYKCCESAPEGSFEVVASAVNAEAGDLTGRWYSTIGGSDLDGLFISADFAPFDDVIVGVYHNDVQVGTASISAGANTGEVTFTPAEGVPQGDYIDFRIEQGEVEMLTVQALMRGEFCGSGGLNFIQTGDPYTTKSP